jgi:hypothetical protein
MAGTHAIWHSNVVVAMPQTVQENPRVYFVSRPEPYRYVRGTGVDQAHHINLMISFHVVVLVDTHSVNPEEAASLVLFFSHLA